jgi:hypothetical protein
MTRIRPQLPPRLGLVSIPTLHFVFVLLVLLAARTPAGAQSGTDDAAKKSSVRPPQSIPRAASKMAELLRLLAEGRQEREAMVAAEAAADRERAELEDEVRALEDDLARWQKPLAALRARHRELEASVKAKELRVKAARERARAIRAAFQKALASIERLVERALPVNRENRLAQVRDARKAAARDRTTLATVAGDLFSLAFKVLSDSRTIQATSGVIPGEGGPSGAKQRVARIIRIGAVQALAIPPGGDEVWRTRDGARGVPVWTEPETAAELAEAVRRGIDILLRRRAPEILRLPIPARAFQGVGSGARKTTGKSPRGSGGKDSKR